jgi:hypothetical protein
MRVTLGSFASAALLAFACAGCSGQETAGQAQASAEPAGELVTAVGCPTTGPQPNCLTIMANGMAYDLTDAGVDTTRGVGISVTGRAAGEAGACGIKLAEVKVSYLGLKCGPPPAPAA